MSVPNSTSNNVVESTKDDWGMVIESPAGELVHNSTEKYNNIVAAK